MPCERLPPFSLRIYKLVLELEGGIKDDERNNSNRYCPGYIHADNMESDLVCLGAK